jgi:predicted RNase H-like HicB family nuclease
MTPTEALEIQAKEAIEGMIEDHILLNNNKVDTLNNNK